INSTNGVINWTPTEAQGPSTNLVTVKVTDDGSPNLSDTKSFTVVVNEVNVAPVLAAIADQKIGRASCREITNAAGDNDVPKNKLGNSVVSWPLGITINSTNGVISWTPTEAQGPSTNLVTVKVTDDGSPNLSDTKSFTVVVNEVNVAPVLAAIADQ